MVDPSFPVMCCLRGDDRGRIFRAAERDWDRLREGEHRDLIPRSGRY